MESAAAITPVYGLSSTIVMTTPLITAGCWPVGNDRGLIRDLLGKLFQLAMELLGSHCVGGQEEDWTTSRIDARLHVPFLPYADA